MTIPPFEANTAPTAKDILRRYPRLAAHIICESLGYAEPTLAAFIIRDAKEGKKTYCEWASACFNNDPKAIIRKSFANRHWHTGFMADYGCARKLVDIAGSAGREPIFASWF